MTAELLLTAVLILTKRPSNPVSFYKRIKSGQVDTVFFKNTSILPLLSYQGISESDVSCLTLNNKHICLSSTCPVFRSVHVKFFITFGETLSHKLPTGEGSYLFILKLTLIGSMWMDVSTCV